MNGFRVPHRERPYARRLGAYLLLGALGILNVLAVPSLLPSPAIAGLGDCGQPVSSGTRPSASDALYTLRAAVGLIACEDIVCDVDGNCVLTAGDALRVLRAAVGESLELACRDDCDATTTTSSTVTTTTVTSTTLPNATWEEVFGIISVYGCGTAGCHGPIVWEADLTGLHDIDLGYDALVGVPSMQLPTMDRVEPFDPQLSYLVHKLAGTHLDVGGEGVQMPNMENPLDAEMVAIVKGWIAGGAQR